MASEEVVSESTIQRAVHEELPDVTQSVIGQVSRRFGNDLNKIMEYFRESVGTGERDATTQQRIDFLREIVPIDGAPDSFYEECIKRAKNNTSVALDIALEESFRINAEKARKARDEALQKAKEAARRAKEEAERKGKDDETHKAKEESERKAKEETERKAKEAERKAKERAERKAKKEAERKAKEAERKAKEEAERKAKEEAERKAKEEAERKAEEEAIRNAEEEVVRKAQAQKAKEEEEARKAKEEKQADMNVARFRELVDKGIVEAPDDDDDSHPRHTDAPDPAPGSSPNRSPTRLCEIKVTSVHGNRISFTWNIPEDVEANEKDWIGLYIHDRQYSNKYERYVYLGGAKSGDSCFTAPGDGYFDLRYYQNKGNEEKSRSEPFLVGEKMEVKGVLEGRRKIIATWNRAAERSGDWIGLYLVSTYSNAQYIQQHPVSSANSKGEIIFDAPRQPGSYELRYFFSSSKHGTGYAYSGKSEQIVIPQEDEMHVMCTHPVLRVHWQTYSQEPSKKDWIGLFDSSDEKAKRLGWEYLATKGLLDGVGDNGNAEIQVKELACLAPEAVLPDGSDKWEVRLYNQAPDHQPFLRVPFVKK